MATGLVDDHVQAGENPGRSLPQGISSNDQPSGAVSSTSTPVDTVAHAVSEFPTAASSATSRFFSVNIKTTDGNITTLQVPSSASGMDLKVAISERLKVPPDRQRLIVRGRVLNDDDIVGQRITEDGQTVHLVQRPDVLPGTDTQAQEGTRNATHRSATSSQAPLGDAATFTAANLLQASGGPGAAGLQVRFQLNTTPQDGQPMPAEVSQMFGSLFGTVGRDLVASLGAGGSNNASAVQEPAVGDAAGGAPSGSIDGVPARSSLWTSLMPGIGMWLRMGLWSSRACLAGLPLVVLVMGMFGGWFTVSMQSSLGGGAARAAQAAANADAAVADFDSEGTVSGSHQGNILPLYGWLICYHAVSLFLGLPALYIALRTSPPVRMIGAWLGNQNSLTQSQNHPQGAVEAAQFLLGQPIATMTLPTSQIFFQQGTEQLGTSQMLIGQGLANQADLVSALLGNINAVPQDAAPREAVPEEAAPQEAESLPWEELQDLSQHLACLLHRPEHSSALRPLHMPHGELHAFLSVLHGAASQLGVGISDMQTSLSVNRGEEQQQRQQQQQQAVQFANVAEATASVLHSLASSVRSRSSVHHTEAHEEPDNTTAA